MAETMLWFVQEEGRGRWERTGVDMEKQGEGGRGLMEIQEDVYVDVDGGVSGDVQRKKYIYIWLSGGGGGGCGEDECWKATGGKRWHCTLYVYKNLVASSLSRKATFPVAGAHPLSRTHRLHSLHWRTQYVDQSFLSYHCTRGQESDNHTAQPFFPFIYTSPCSELTFSCDFLTKNNLI